MKILATCLAILTIWGSARGQTPTSTDQKIARIMQRGAYDGWDEKQLSGAGDGAAVDVIRIIGGERPSDITIAGALTVIHLAFSAPKLILSPADRNPCAALFLLQYLRLVTKSPDLQERIRTETSFLKNATRKSSERPKPGF